MRLAVGEVKQEANTFSPVPTTLRDFEAEHFFEGEQLLRSLINTKSELCGFLERASALNADVVPLVAASAISGGPVTADTYGLIADRLLQRLKAAGPVDGVFLALHGAMVADVPGGEDATGLLLHQVRAVVGPAVPIIATLDLHANVTRRMASTATAIIGYRTWPHVDQAERGQEAADLLAATVRGEVRPACALSKLRMVLQVENGQTSSGPLAELLALARAWEAQGDCLSGSVFLVQPWLDLPEMGCAVTIICNRDGAQAQRLADELGRQVWALRHAFDVPLVPSGEALDRAIAAPGRPVVLADSADSTGSGAPGDSTAILRELLERQVACRVLIPMVDREAVAAAYEAGLNATLRLSLGGKLDSLHSRPVDLEAVVEWLGDLSFRFSGPVFTGLETQAGRVAVLMVRDTHILVSERPVWTVDPALYRAAGLEPTEAQIVVVKSPNQFRAAYGPIAYDIMVVDAPGLASGNIRDLPFRRLPRPFYPLDEDWPGAPWAAEA